MPAEVEALSGLHEKITETFVEMLKNPKDLTAAELSVIVKFLKDNDITALPAKGSKMGRLANKVAQILPFPGEDPALAVGDG